MRTGLCGVWIRILVDLNSISLLDPDQGGIYSIEEENKLKK